MKIVFLEPLGIPNEQLLAQAEAAVGRSVELIAYPDRREDEETLVKRSEGADIVVLSNFPYRKNVISRLPDLKMICVAFTGTDHVDVAYCRERGITVCNCAGYSTVAVADLVFGLVIALARNILPCDAACRQGGTKAGLVGFDCGWPESQMPSAARCWPGAGRRRMWRALPIVIHWRNCCPSATSYLSTCPRPRPPWD